MKGVWNRGRPSVIVTKVTPGVVPRIVCVLLAVLVPVGARAADGAFRQRIEWRTDGDAMEYRVELRPAAGGNSTFMRTDTNFVELSLPAGSYRYRVYAYDFLGRESTVSQWTSLEILKASQPEIIQVQADVTTSVEDGSVEMAVEIADVTMESTAELVGADGAVIAGSLAVERAADGAVGSEVQRAVRVRFAQVPAGEWRLRVTNPSGFSAESDVIAVTDGAEAARVEAERLAAEAEAARVEAERLAAEEAARVAEAERLAAEEAAAADAAAREQERRAAEYAEWLQTHPAPDATGSAEDVPRKRYESHDITFAVGLGSVFSPYDGTLLEYSDAAYIAALTARLSAFPVRLAGQRIGFELNGTLSGGFPVFKYNKTVSFGLVQRNSYYDARLSLLGVQAFAVWQHRLITDKMYVSLKGGGGMLAVAKDIEYSTGSRVTVGVSFSRVGLDTGYAGARAAGGAESGAEAQEGQSRDQPAAEVFTYLTAGGGISLFFIPFKFLVVELGADFAHVFIPGMPTGLVTPYLSIGLRL